MRLTNPKPPDDDFVSPCPLPIFVPNARAAAKLGGKAGCSATLPGRIPPFWRPRG